MTYFDAPDETSELRREMQEQQAKHDKEIVELRGLIQARPTQGGTAGAAEDPISAELRQRQAAARPKAMQAKTEEGFWAALAEQGLAH